MGIFDQLVNTVTGGAAPLPVPQLDLNQLATDLAPLLRDPDSEFEKIEVVRPSWSKQTEGPHRYTIYVPYNDGARLSIGAAHGILGSPGITAETKTHIHLNAYEGCPTYLGLGMPSKNIGVLGKLHAGYTLETEGHSTHEAKLDVNLASRESSIRIDAATNLVFMAGSGDISAEAGGSVRIKGGKKVAISAGQADPVNGSVFGALVLTALDAADFAAPTVGFKAKDPDTEHKAALGAATGNWLAGLAGKETVALRDKWVAAYSESVDQALGHLGTILGLLAAFKPNVASPDPEKSGWEVVSGMAGWFFSATSEIKSLWKDYVTGKDPDDPGLTLTAESMIDINAKTSVKVTGPTGVSINGFKGVSVTGLSVNLKGHKESVVWGGLGAGLKALAGDAVVTSDFKGVTIGGKKDVKITSVTGKAVLGSKDDAKVSSDKRLNLVGKESTLLLAGGANGHGVVGHPSKVVIGTLKSADPHSGAVGDEDKQLATFDSGAKQVTIQSSSSSKLKILPGSIEIDTPQVTLSSGGTVKLKGKFVEIN